MIPQDVMTLWLLIKHTYNLKSSWRIMKITFEIYIYLQIAVQKLKQHIIMSIEKNIPGLYHWLEQKLIVFFGCMVILMLFGKIQKAYGLMALKIWILYFSLLQTQQTVHIKLGNGYQKSHTLKIYELNVREAIQT